VRNIFRVFPLIMSGSRRDSKNVRKASVSVS